MITFQYFELLILNKKVVVDNLRVVKIKQTQTDIQNLVWFELNKEAARGYVLRSLCKSIYD